jgi:acyl dehydratase
MNVRYFEDVEVGEELPVVERVPTQEYVLEFLGGMENVGNPAFADAEAGRRMGVGGVLVPGPVKLAWLMQWVSDWAGTKGSVLSLRAAFRRPDIAGRPLLLTGHVVDKREENGRRIVELEVATIAEGQPSIRGNVQVELPGRPA